MGKTWSLWVIKANWSVWLKPTRLTLKDMTNISFVYIVHSKDVITLLGVKVKLDDTQGPHEYTSMKHAFLKSLLV